MILKYQLINKTSKQFLIIIINLFVINIRY